MSKGNRTEVIIAGRRLAIMSDDKPEYLKEVSKCVDNSISELLSSNKGMSLERAAIFSALKFCDDIHKMKEKSNMPDDEDRLMKQIIEYSNELSKIQQENRNLKKIISEYEKQIKNN